MLKKEKITWIGIVKIIYEDHPTQAELALLSDGLCAEAYKKRGLAKIEAFCFLLKEETLQIMGGIEGVTYYGYMHIGEFFIEENLKNWAMKWNLAAKPTKNLQFSKERSEIGVIPSFITNYTNIRNYRFVLFHPFLNFL